VNATSIENLLTLKFVLNVKESELTLTIPKIEKLVEFLQAVENMFTY